MALSSRTKKILALLDEEIPKYESTKGTSEEERQKVPGDYLSTYEIATSERYQNLPQIVIHKNILLTAATNDPRGRTERDSDEYTSNSIASENELFSPKHSEYLPSESSEVSKTSEDGLDNDQSQDARDKKRKWIKVKRIPDLCYFCDTKVLNFARHLLSNHKGEIEV
nr:unnamed protein product [Callosobruchus analis]